VVTEELLVVAARGLVDLQRGGSDSEEVEREREEVERALVVHFGHEAARELVKGVKEGGLLALPSLCRTIL
jgi:hypothetical protein